jgi:hypothetical protein
MVPVSYCLGEWFLFLKPWCGIIGHKKLFGPLKNIISRSILVQKQPWLWGSPNSKTNPQPSHLLGTIKPFFSSSIFVCPKRGYPQIHLCLIIFSRIHFWTKPDLILLIVPWSPDYTIWCHAMPCLLIVYSTPWWFLIQMIHMFLLFYLL